MKRYPHILYRQRVEESTVDAQGNYVNSESPTWVMLGTCREQPNSAGKSISGDGDSYVFRSLVYLPGVPLDVASGDRIQVRHEGGSIRTEGDVIRYERGQINARIWL